MKFEIDIAVVDSTGVAATMEAEALRAAVYDALDSALAQVSAVYGVSWSIRAIVEE
jgi:hypothetical protein